MAKGAWGITAVDVLGEELDGTAGARLVALQGVVKQNSPGSPYLVANEFICGRLAMCMGLPVPAGDILRFADGTLGYLSLRFGSEMPPSVIPKDFVKDNAELALRISTFDCWIANDDRHEGNLAYSQGLIPPMVFDHDKAILGPGVEGLSGPERLDKTRDEAILNGCIVQYISNIGAISDIAAQVRAIANHSLPGICDAAEKHGALNNELRGAVEEFLAHRARTLVTLMGKLNLSGQTRMA